MQGTAEITNIGTDERQVLETVLDHPESTLSEIANRAKLLPPLTYEIVSSLRMQELLLVREDDAGTRRYTVTAEAFEVLGKEPPEVKTPEAEEQEAEENRTERSHASALKRIEPLAEFPHALKEPEQRELVLKAIDEKYRTLDGIKRRVGFPAWFDMTELLAGMNVDHLIRKESKGDLAAYFRYNDKPLRFWRIGDGRIEAEFDPDFMPRDEAAKTEEFAGRAAWVNYPEKKQDPAGRSADIDIEIDEADFDPDYDDAPIGRPADAFESKVIAQNGSSSEVRKTATPAKKRTGPTAKVDISVEQLEKAMSGSKNAGQICEQLGVGMSCLYSKLNGDPDLKASYENWQARLRGSRSNSKRENSSAKSLDLDVDEVERLAREGKTAKEAAADLGMTYFVFKNRLNAKTGPNKPIRDAWYRGRKAAGSPIKVNKRPVKAPHKTRDRSADIKPVVETVTVESSIETPDKTPDRSNGIASDRQIPFAIGYAPPGSLGMLEDLSFNVGNAVLSLLHVEGADAIESAIWFLEREKARRERATKEA
jgi:DNA-binding MarR family transcriptional regulator